MITTTVTTPWNKQEYNVEIEPRQSIRIYGETNRSVSYTPKQFDLTFEIGDTAEYDSYNMRYTGKILAIGAKTVTIDAHGTGEHTRRLTLAQFASRNWDFDLEKIQAENLATSYTI